MDTTILWHIRATAYNAAVKKDASVYMDWRDFYMIK